MKSIYDIPLNSADGSANFLEQFKGKVTLIVNTTVGCGNANQLEVLQWLQEKYGGDNFQIVAIPTNDYCGPGITKGRWSQGITCGMDSKLYGEEIYGVTFQYSEMISSNPNSSVGDGKNGLGQPHGKPHELYKEIQKQMYALEEIHNNDLKEDYLSPWLSNNGFYGGAYMGGNFEKYLVDKNGYVSKWYACTVLNYDIEKTLKEKLIEEGTTFKMGIDRSSEIFDEEYRIVCQHIEELI